MPITASQRAELLARLPEQSLQEIRSAALTRIVSDRSPADLAAIAVRALEALMPLYGALPVAQTQRLTALAGQAHERASRLAAIRAEVSGLAPAIGRPCDVVAWEEVLRAYRTDSLVPPVSYRTDAPSLAQALSDAFASDVDE